MGDVIVLSDSEEEFEKPKKLKLTKSIEPDDKCYVIDDEDEITNEKSNVEAIKIDISKTQMAITIQKNGQDVFKERKDITHVTDANTNKDVSSTSTVVNDITPSLDTTSTVTSSENIQSRSSNTNGLTDVNANNSNEESEISEPIPMHVLNFIDVCEKNIHNEEVKRVFLRKVKSFKKFSQKATSFVNSETFKTFLNDAMQEIKEMPSRNLGCFIHVYNELQAAYHKQSGIVSASDKHRGLIRKLEMTLEKLHKKIKKLEKKEVNFDDDVDSAYMQYCRYKERIIKVHIKYCELLKTDQRSGQIIYNRLDFAKSNYNQINKALNRKYKNNSVFPTYYDVDKVIRKCVEENSLNLTEKQIEVEVKHCFQEIGNLMQRRRKTDLHSVHNSYLKPDQLKDPAETDPELNAKLKQNSAIAQKKINELCEQYTRKQELGETVALSEDSDDSHHKEDSDED